MRSPSSHPLPGFDERPVIVDVRGPNAYRRGHLRGAVSVPRTRLEGSAFLLPPRERPVLLVARDAATAAEAAGLLGARGRTRVAWLDGSMRDLPGTLVRTGWDPNRTWQPAELLRRYIRRLPRDGEAIDLACGSGREAAYLALHRARVQGADILKDALARARVLARAAGVAPGRLTLRRVDLTDAGAVSALLRPGHFRVILCFRYLDRALFPSIIAALAPGGWLLYQTFLEEQARIGRRPGRAAYLLKSGELRSIVAGAGGVRIIHHAEGPDEHGDHLASLVARRDD